MNCENCGKEIFWYHLGSIWLHSGLIAYSYCNLPTAWDLTASPKIEFELVKEVRDDKRIDRDA